MAVHRPPPPLPTIARTRAPAAADRSLRPGEVDAEESALPARRPKPPVTGLPEPYREAIVLTGHEGPTQTEAPAAPQPQPPLDPQSTGGQQARRPDCSRSAPDRLPARLVSTPPAGPVLDEGSYRQALRDGRFDRRPMFTRLDGDAVVWSDGTREHVDVVRRPLPGPQAEEPSGRTPPPGGRVAMDGSPPVTLGLVVPLVATMLIPSRLIPSRE